MKFIPFPYSTFFDPDKTEPKDLVGDAGKELKDLYKRKQYLYLRVKTFLKKLKKVNDIAPFLKNQEIKKITQSNKAIYEMRIPQMAQGGVFRIYFCFSENDSQTLILLCAELKHKKEPMKLETAFNNMNKYKDYFKQGVMQ